MRPQDPYATAKWFGELLCDRAVERADIRCTSIRPCWVQDEESYPRNLGPIVRDPSVLIGNYCSYVDVYDLCDAVVLAIETDLPGHEVFYIASPDTIGGHPLAETVRTHYGGDGDRDPAARARGRVRRSRARRPSGCSAGGRRAPGATTSTTRAGRSREDARARQRRDRSCRPSASGRGPSAGRGSSAGARSTTTSRSPRSATRSSAASTGSTPPRSTGSATPRRSSDARSSRSAPARTSSSSRSAGGAGRAVPTDTIENDLRPASIREECEDSLRRLGVERIDLFQFHWPDWTTGTALEESWGTMARARRRGQGALGRRLQLRRGAARALRGDSPRRLRPAAAVAARARRALDRAALGGRARDGRHRLLADGLRACSPAPSTPSGSRGSTPTTGGASRRSSPSRCSAATSRSSSGCGRSPSGSGRRCRRSRSRGRWRSRASPARSSAPACRATSTAGCRAPTSSSTSAELREIDDAIADTGAGSDEPPSPPPHMRLARS